MTCDWESAFHTAYRFKFDLQHKKLGVITWACNPSSMQTEKVDSWDSLANQPSGMGIRELQVKLVKDEGANQMTQSINTKPDNLSSILRTHKIEGDN